VFSQSDFATITQAYTKRPITLAELYEVRSKITELYVNSGYITSGAYIPPQALTGSVVKIQIRESGLEDIKVLGSRQLNPNYVRRRLAIATTPPLNQKRLLAALQLLQLNPLIKSIAAELSAGTKPSENLLTVNVIEAPRWNLQTNLDNGRTPSVGTFRRQFQLSNANLFGLGDSLSISYTNTVGSNSFNASYVMPFNPRNGTIALSGGFASSRVIEQPFNGLDINSNSNYVELTVRQPLLQTTTQELTLGLTISHRKSSATLLGGEIPFPSPGADDQGNTRVTALRFFQEYTRRNQTEVLAFRSQFNFGLNALNATMNATSPDSNFLVWRGQAQYVRRLAADAMLLLRSDIQLADRPLLPLEQFGLGGQDSVRGYRQDQLLTDSGVFASAEVRIPILRLPKLDNAVLQLAPFIDLGYGFNQSSGHPVPDTLVSAGLGLRLQVGNRLTARFDWGIPLTQISGDRRTLQEQGLYFSLAYNYSF
jgi:hemolysin activation/secretion protein